MIPEIEVTCRGKRYFINSITVEQYKKYISLMEKNSTEKISGVMFFNTKIVQELFGNELTLAEIGEIDVIDFLTAIKTVHFVMQNIIAEKLLNIVEVEQVEKEKSAFDEYDRENGYEDRAGRTGGKSMESLRGDCRPCCKNCDSAFEKLIQSVHERKHCHVVGILAF